MAEIIPFRALRYHQKIAGDLANLVTQPYDKITPEMQARYYQASPYNLVRIILGHRAADDTAGNNVYTRARADFRDWIARGVLEAEREPAFYAYSQDYVLPGSAGVKKVRQALIGLCRIEDYSAGIIHRHEETLAGPKADRMELLKATRAHFGQIFLLYSDPAGEIERLLARRMATAPDQAVKDELGTVHSVGRIGDAETIERLSEWMKDKKMVIADGHHRYETALAYRNACRAQGGEDLRAEYVMVTMVRLESENLTILPTHRVVYSLARFDWSRFLADSRRYFDVQEIPAAPADALLETLHRAGEQRPSWIAFAGANRVCLLGLRADLNLADELPDVAPGVRRLDVVLLHRLAIEKILQVDRQAVREEKNLHYERGAQAAIQAVEANKAQLAFLMNPTPVADAWSNALGGQPMPQKSTDFYPKMLSGLTIYWLDNPAGI